MQQSGSSSSLIVEAESGMRRCQFRFGTSTIMDFDGSAVDANEEVGEETLMCAEGPLNGTDNGRMSEGIFLVEHNELPVGAVFMRLSGQAALVFTI